MEITIKVIRRQPLHASCTETVIIALEEDRTITLLQLSAYRGARAGDQRPTRKPGLVHAR